MLRPAKFTTVLIALFLLLSTSLFLSSHLPPHSSSSPIPAHSTQQTASGSCSAERDPRPYPDAQHSTSTRSRIVHKVSSGTPHVLSSQQSIQKTSPTANNQASHSSQSSKTFSKQSKNPSTSTGSRLIQDGEERYLMYIPYAGITNQLFSVWHGSMMARALNRTLLLPNIVPNVHVGTESNGKEPAPTKWSEFFDLEQYSKVTGLKIVELEDFLTGRGVIERAAVVDETKEFETKTNQKRKREIHAKEQGKQPSVIDRRRIGKRWVRLESSAQDEGSSVASAPLTSGSGSVNARPKFRSVKYPTVQKCYSEAGYGMDRRIDLTGRLFMQRYRIDPTLNPTPFIDPENDNTIWARLRMDKAIERYQQPEFEQQEILCIGHVYRLLPGGKKRAWNEFGQHFRYTEKVESFVDGILEKLIPESQKANGSKDHPKQRLTVQESAFVGVHLRRGDFEQYCHGIASPADPNGWNRCYPSTEHVISLLQNVQTPTSPLTTGKKGLLKRQINTPDLDETTPTLPVLALTNEKAPEELAKADAHNWIRVDHAQLGTTKQFGRYGPALIDGALLARAQLLVGVEYSTYFRTASWRAEEWYGGRTVLVT
ncbi:hypothetical protein BGW38_003121 [Lunasporangiospora selenospora]|uniref:GDP-fucose protein O-fucosyltransferase 2 n=1 Tax=Lunasporangiospora selenospora TaxID=979761 RepID=A0A9P6G0R2_9FUNG|nr:hypothetical protein BGW38_003121 [Lunasporangiospora selenospora]